MPTLRVLENALQLKLATRGFDLDQDLDQLKKIECPSGVHELTPLMFAVGWGNDETVSAIFKAGARIEAENRFGETALLLALLKKVNHDNGWPSRNTPVKILLMFLDGIQSQLKAHLDVVDDELIDEMEVTKFLSRFIPTVRKGKFKDDGCSAIGATALISMLRNLIFSIQKAALISEHLSESEQKERGETIQKELEARQTLQSLVMYNAHRDSLFRSLIEKTRSATLIEKHAPRKDGEQTPSLRSKL